MITEDAARKVTRSADRTVKAVQIAEAVMLGIALVAIVVLSTVVFQQHSTVQAQAATLRVQQTELVRAQKQITLNERRVLTACSFWKDLGELPVSLAATKLGIGIVVHSRTAFTGFVCIGKLSPVSPELRTLAHKYGLTPR